MGDNSQSTRRAPNQGLRATIEMTQNATQIIEAFLDGADPTMRVIDAWKRVKNAVIQGLKGDNSRRAGDASHDHIESKEAKEIKEQIQELKGIIQGITEKPREFGKPLTFAEVARNATSSIAPNPNITSGIERVKPVPSRRTREVIIAPGNETTTQRQRTGQQLVKELNETIGESDIVAARRLPSGDILATFQGEKEKTKWESQKKLLQAFGEDARVRIREYTILAHGIHVAAINLANQNKAIAEIYSQNPRIKDKVKIVRLGWSKKALSQGKTRSALYIGVASPEQANLLLNQGLLFESELHDCEVFEGECQVTQCFKCMEYGHIAKQCKNLIKCGFCAAIGHLSQDCLKKNDRNSHHYAICKKPGARHTAWARECPTRKEMVEKARRAYLLRPAKFQERTQPQESAHPYESARTQEGTQGRAQERSQESAQERAQERAQEGSQERAQERAQDRAQERSQERTQDKFRGRTQESTQA